MRDLVSLLGHCRSLQGHLFGAHFFELAVVATVAHELGVIHVHRHLGDGIQEFAVMADHHHGARVALEPGFQPDQGVQVQVVGGFVEQQQVGRAHQRARQLQAHAPAAREAVDRVIQFRRGKPQAENQGLGTGSRIVGTGIIECHVRLGHAHAVSADLCGGHFGLCSEERGIALDHEVGRALLGLRHILRHLRHAPLAGNREFAAIFMQCAIEQTEE